MHQFFQSHLDGGAKGIYDFVVFGDSFTELNAYSYHAYFTDEIIDNGDGEQIQVLKPTATSEILAKTLGGKIWALRDGDLYIIANTGWNGGVASNDQCSVVNYLDLIDFDAPGKTEFVKNVVH